MEKHEDTMKDELLANDIYYQAFIRSPELSYLIDKHCSLIACNNNLLNYLGQPSLTDTSPGTLYKLMMLSNVCR